MSKFRALVVTALLAGSLTVGSVAATTADAKAPGKNGPVQREGSSWCC
ncbi:hypothetical protein [Nocardioides sp. 1609]|nr:hypothetical protein [Nocardioides sp. 1609]